MRTNSYKRGYTLLFAVLAATLVLGVAIFIVSSSRKQFLLASNARESMFAIYAADSGIECALKAFAVDYSLDANSPKEHTSAGTPMSIKCNSKNYDNITFAPTPGVSGYVSTPAPYQTGEVFVDLGNKQCADLIITNGTTTSGSIKLQFESRGYNICKTSGTGVLPDDSNPKIVERAIQLKYLTCNTSGVCSE